MNNSFDARTELKVGDKKYEIYSCARLAGKYPVDKLPFAQKILLENLLRTEDGVNVTRDDIEALAKWDAEGHPRQGNRLHPGARTDAGLHRRACVVDLAAMRDAMSALGGDPNKINPLIAGGTRHRPLRAGRRVRHQELGRENAKIEFDRNQERYGFLRWGQEAFDNFKVVPPDTGIVHQVNLEYLGARHGA
jgi:aconitate hydratase